MNPEEIRDELQARVGPVTLSFTCGAGAITVPADCWHAAALSLRDEPKLAFDFLRSLSGVDWPEAGQIEVVIHLLSYSQRHTLVVKTRVDREVPVLASLADVWPAANWHERELYDLFGVRLDGHPDLRRLLLDDDWVGHPLRKDYRVPESHLGIPMQRPVLGEEIEPLHIGGR